MSEKVKHTDREHGDSYSRHHKESLADKFLGTSKRNKVHSAQRIKSLSRSTSKRKLDSYMLISRRVIFCTIFMGIIIYICYYAFIADTTDQTLSSAQLTNSETNQLKIQITQLRQKVDDLESELARYKALYGELDEVTEE